MIFNIKYLILKILKMGQLNNYLKPCYNNKMKEINSKI